MLCAPNRFACLAFTGIALALLSSSSTAQLAGLASLQDDLAPITNTNWNYEPAAHLLELAG